MQNCWQGSNVDLVIFFARNTTWGVITPSFPEKKRCLNHAGHRNSPTFQPQPRDPLEFRDVPRHQRRIMSTRNSRNQKIVGPDHLSSRGKIRADQCIMSGTGIVEGQALQRRKEKLEPLQVCIDARASVSTEQQLCLDNAAERDIGRRTCLRGPFSIARNASVVTEMPGCRTVGDIAYGFLRTHRLSEVPFDQSVR